MGFTNYCLKNGGIIKPLTIPFEYTKGTGLFNPSVFVDEEENILVNIRHCQYTLYHSEKGNYEHIWGPLIYLNPENDISLTTTNFFCKLDSELNIEEFHQVDTSELDEKPLWEFVGLEDSRIVKWDGKYFLCGVRRDTTRNGVGRMELSELKYVSEKVKEISRQRIPAPGKDDTYCEKNWMPILDQPYHYVKWSNPVEIVKYNPADKTCKTTFLGEYDESINIPLRGGSQVIPYKDGYLAIHHITHLFKSKQDRKNATYRHQFTYWDKNWKVIKRSKIFDFMGAEIEFACGMAKYNKDYIITFGFQDNAAFALKISEDALENFIND